MSGALAGRSALVTGAGRGIGRAVALGLAAEGARVALLSRTAHELSNVAAEVSDAGGTALTVSADVGDPTAVAEAAARVLEEFDEADILINNAAVVAPLGPTLEVDADLWAAALAVNVVAVVRLSQLLLPGMIKREWGRIVNVSSGIAAHPESMIGMNAYASSKSALEAHSLNLAAELAGSGVTVNVYRPGSVDTAMQGWIRSQSPDEIGATLHRRFVESFDRGTLITPEHSAQSLLARITSNETGRIWSVGDVA